MGGVGKDVDRAVPEEVLGGVLNGEDAEFEMTEGNRSGGHLYRRDKERGIVAISRRMWFKGVSADIEGKGRAGRVLDRCPLTM